MDVNLTLYWVFDSSTGFPAEKAVYWLAVEESIR